MIRVCLRYLQVDDSPNPLQFSQVFQLIPDGASYYVYVLLICLFQPISNLDTDITIFSASITHKSSRIM